MMINQIILCADDYSQNDDICVGILSLLDKKRLNATSCLVNEASWHTTHQALNPFKKKVYIGLHFNLTFGKPLSKLWKKKVGGSFNGLRPLFRRCFLIGYLKDAIAAEMNAQMDAFTHAMGKSPDFIDGHQHVHQLPGIRDVLIELHTKQKWTGFIRNTSNGLNDYLSLSGFPKRQLIALLGGNAIRNLLSQQNIATNTRFAGIYNFKNAVNYRDYFKQFLKLSQQGSLIMCHPGTRSNDTHDPLYQSRYHEYDYLMSDAFLEDLAVAGISLFNPAIEKTRFQ